MNAPVKPTPPMNRKRKDPGLEINLWKPATRLAQIFVALMLLSGVGAVWGLGQAIHKGNQQKLEMKELELQLKVASIYEATRDSTIYEIIELVKEK
jgi:hypothetical protein